MIALILEANYLRLNLLDTMRTTTRHVTLIINSSSIVIIMYVYEWRALMHLLRVLLVDSLCFPSGE